MFHSFAVRSFAKQKANIGSMLQCWRIIRHCVECCSLLFCCFRLNNRATFIACCLFDCAEIFTCFSVAVQNVLKMVCFATITTCQNIHSVAMNENRNSCNFHFSCAFCLDNRVLFFGVFLLQQPPIRPLVGVCFCVNAT